ncbi:DMT family transporter [Methylorubrum sp. Q1]|uniref:DMT family transporter n=1 Tax=Methylorubrum sp. Q1 TaxID=2562453 RepID=UPI001FDF04E6|nr:DMT family transporter [Methylorubrum sp. Q1]
MAQKFQSNVPKGGCRLSEKDDAKTRTSSIVLDHFGLLGVPLHEANLPRLGGALFLLAGVALICIF